ncbi:MAG: thioredoxin family protein [Bacillaceae bacterium]
METLQSIEQFEQLKQEKNVLFMFSAQWCRDCVFINPFLPELEEQNADFKWVYINRDDYIELCQENDVFGIPSFVAFSEGKEIGRYVSKDRKTPEEIQSFVDSLR